MEEQIAKGSVAETEEQVETVIFRLHRRDDYVPPVKTETPAEEPAPEPAPEPAGPMVVRRSAPPVGCVYPLLHLTRRARGEESEAEVPAETPAEEPAETAGEPELQPAEPLDLPAEAAVEQEAEHAQGGRLGELEYTANSIDGAPVKRAYVYLPEGYSEEQTYPVLYLLHGIGGDENEWLFGGNGRGECVRFLDAMISAGEIEPCVVVFPNGRTCADFKNTSSEIIDGEILRSENVAGFYVFDRELRSDLIPAAEAAYSIRKDRAGRALAGLSMGGVQTVNLGLMKCNDLFAQYGAFSFGPSTADGGEVAEALGQSGFAVKLLYLCCGDADALCFPVYEAFTKRFEGGKGTVQLYHESVFAGGGHDFGVWNRGLAEFLGMAFSKEK